MEIDRDDADLDPMKIDPMEVEPIEIDSMEVEPIGIDGIKVEAMEIDPLNVDDGMVESRQLANQIEALQRQLATQKARLARAEETIKGRGEVIEAGNKACQVLDKEVRTLKSQLEDEREAHMAEAAAIKAEYSKKMADLDLSLAIEKVKYIPAEGSDDGLNDDDSESEKE
ncbi:hypothetical protein N7454_004931 [Penicillium verhagenii]|nr:hypothetical protein N7454_004931 [Penicillium verhagenii]